MCSFAWNPAEAVSGFGVKTVDVSPRHWLFAIGGFNETFQVLCGRAGKVLARETLGAILPHHFPGVGISISAFLHHLTLQT